MPSFASLALVFALLVCCLSAQEVGTVAGTVFDASTAQPVRQARVEVEGLADKTVVTDLDGKYAIQLPVGKYTLKFAAENYSPAAVEDIQVTAGQIVEASTVMANSSAVTTVEVTERVGAVAATAEAALTERKLASVVSDAISSEEIKAGTASTAAAAVEKVTGVSIVNNGYVYVRGLGERYSATMLNSAMIPTTEPEKRVVPLDLFPAALIENVRILKTYSPDLPGEFAGGLVQMNTVEFPTAKLFRVSASTGFNTATTGSTFLSYPGGGRDFFGFDDGTRNLPGSIPSDQRLFPGQFPSQQVGDFGRSFSNNWEPTFIDGMRPNQTYSMVGGGTFGRFGLIGAITFTNKPQRYTETQNFLRNAGSNQPVIFTRYPDFRDNIESARMGGVLNAAIRLNATNKIVFRNTLTHDTDKESRIFQGYAGTLDSVIRDYRLRHIERGLLSSSVEGDHAMARLGNSVLHWQFTYSKSNRDEPDLREVVYGQQDDGSFRYLARPESGLRFFNYLKDTIYEPQTDITRPFFKGPVSGIFKVGFRGTFRRRDFDARRFRFVPPGRGVDLTLLPNQLFAAGNIGPNLFELREVTRGTDRYNADMDIYAGYGMVDMALGARWRLIGGVRIEDADIRVRTIDPLVPGAVPSVASLVNRDPLPGVNLIYALTPRQNLRFGYSRTVSRPDFRELSPFEFTNVVGGYSTVGNPNLVRSKIDNFDARWEWFLGGNQVIAASYFFKRFDDPIEVSIQATADIRQSFLNADAARNQGIELEWRKSLGFLGRSFQQLMLGANFTIVDSDVTLPQGEVNLTSLKRPLVGQSRYIVNAQLEWNRPQWRSNARFFANSVSRRITDVGTFGLPDVYQERNTFLDFVYQYDVREDGRWNLRFSAENLADNNYLWTQAGITQRSYRLGRTFTVGTSITIF